jgi:TolA-binding protein
LVNAKKYKEAVEVLKSVADAPGEYRDLGSYYYGYACLMMGDYPQAISSFERIKDKGYDNVRFYLAQVHYQMSNYDFAIAELDKVGKTVPQNQVLWLKGKCYFRKNSFDKAAEAYRLAELSPDTLKVEERYEIGYSFYRTGDYAGSLKWLSSVAAEGDSLSQIASFQLGNALMKQKNNREAMNAYAEAFRTGFDPSIAEMALFNQAKLAIQLGDNGSIGLLDKYVKLFPNNPNAKEATKLKARLLINTDSYREAVSLLDGLGELDAQTEEVYQKVTLARGMELYKARNLKGAIELFDKCASKRSNMDLNAQSKFWKAETLMLMGDEAAATKGYQDFLDLPSATSTEMYPYAYYGLGYMKFQQKKYDEAASNFSRFTTQAAQGRYDERMVHDGYLRLGDCNFMIKQLNDAVKAYAYVTGKKGTDADYALYQSGLIYGLLTKSEEKVSTMKRLNTDFPNSRFVVDAYFECAEEYMVMGRSAEAEKYYNDILQKFPSNPKANRAYSTLGRIYYNNNKLSNAVEVYSKLYDNYPGTPEAQAANDMVRKIYSEQGDAKSYVRWKKDRGGISDNDQDSLMYETGYNAYEKGEFAVAKKGFDAYLADFPKGSFYLSAHYYLAQTNEELKNSAEAIKHYSVVALANSGELKEDAALAVLKLSGENPTCDQVLAYVEVLEPITQSRQTKQNCWKTMMYCYARNGNTTGLETISAKVLADEGTPVELRTEAKLILVKADIKAGKTENAMADLKAIYSKENNRFAAEAKYLEAELLYSRDSIAACQASCYVILDEFNGYDMWVGKALILLGDAFKKEGDFFNAKATWNGVIENFDVAELVAIAKEKLAQLAAEQAKNPK